MASDPAAEISEQRPTWAELLLDLVWVFAVTEIAGSLAGASGLGDAARTIPLLLPLWWGWVGVTLLGNAAGQAIDTARGRLILFVLAGCGLAMTIAIPQAYGSRGLLFAGAYLLLRLLLWTELRRLPAFSGLRVEPFTVSLFVSGPLFLAGGFATGGIRLATWAAAGLIELASPALLGHRLDPMRFEPAHLPERFGLFIIIALGETVAAVGEQASSRHLDTWTSAGLVLGFVLIGTLWWTYFHYGAPAVRYSLRTNPTQARIVRDVFSYAHLIYVTAIIGVAVGIDKLLADPLATPHTASALLLPFGAGLYLLGFCYARWRMFGAALIPRSAGALACFIITGTAPLIPAIAVGVLVMAVFVAVNAVEAWIVETKRPLPVLKLPRRSTPMQAR